ncbi:DUF3847 domain-containing protein [Christensenellaceae bacterium OttesenSCG-928-L17]|nr:DUF3847 domain-containing protein [Christensenellaceae bacterium OttesenSCG-928-L17]
MASKRTLDERIAEMKLKKEQAENQLKQLLTRQKEAVRKARAHRLIERGAMLESMIDGADALTNEQIKSVLAVALGTDAAIEAIIAAQEKPGATAAAQPEVPQGAGPAGTRETTQGAGA